MKGIFISYRQEDAKPWALMLRDELVRAFGEENVFLDLDNLHAGNWRSQLEAVLSRSKVMLVVMGPRWLRGEGGVGNPDERHRQEIALALSTPGLAVIPVRVEGAAMPRAEQLGADIRALIEQHSREIADASAHRALDLKLLVGDIEHATGLAARPPAPVSASTPAPVSAAAPPGGKTRLFIAAAILSVIFLVIAQLSWTTPPDTVESSFLVLLALLLTMAGAWVKTRLGRKGK